MTPMLNDQGKKKRNISNIEGSVCIDRKSNIRSEMESGHFDSVICD